MKIVICRYREKRSRNNEAAKKSRIERRNKEEKMRGEVTEWKTKYTRAELEIQRLQLELQRRDADMAAVIQENERLRMERLQFGMMTFGAPPLDAENDENQPPPGQVQQQEMKFAQFAVM